jgi:hypothetical protein
MIRTKYYRGKFVFPCIVFTQTSDNIGHAGVILESGKGRSKFKTTAFLKAMLQDFNDNIPLKHKRIPVCNKNVVKNDGSWNVV